MPLKEEEEDRQSVYPDIRPLAATTYRSLSLGKPVLAPEAAVP